MELTNDRYSPNEPFEEDFATVLQDEIANTLNLSDRASPAGGGGNG